jgi:hypothetical protein
MPDLREAIFPVLALAAVLFGFWGGPYVLRPMDKAAKAKFAPVQFTILDFFSLTAYYAVPLAFVAAISKSAPGGQFAANTILIGGGSVATLIWWGSVRTAAKAGIRHTWKRLLMIGLIVPLTYPMSLMGGGFVVNLIYQLIRRGQTAPLWFYLIIPAWIAYFFIARRVVLWILSADAPKEETGDPWSDED